MKYTRKFSEEESDDTGLFDEEEIIQDYNEQEEEPDRAADNKHRKFIPVIFALAAVCIAAGIIIVKNTESRRKADLYKYFEIGTVTDRIPVAVDGEVIGFMAYTDNGICYLSGEAVKEYVTDKFYYDSSENVVLYTTPYEVMEIPVGGNTFGTEASFREYPYVIAYVKDDELFLAVNFLEEITGMEYRLVNNPERLAVTVPGTEFERILLKEDSAVRTGASIKSTIIGKSSEDIRWYLTSAGSGSWYEVTSEDGRKGYVKKKNVTGTEKTVFVQQEKVTYPSLTADHKMTIVWDGIYSAEDNNTIAARLEKVTGVNVISPTWYKVLNENGDIESLADHEYVEYVRSMGYEIWPLISDFNSVDKEKGFSEKELLSDRTSRTRLIKNIMQEISDYGYDGINIDFEKVKSDSGEDYTQFIRELSIECRKAGVVLSVDFYVPAGHNMHYDRKACGECVDYFIVMCYDEHYAGGNTAGSTASIGFVTDGIKNTLDYVTAEKIIVGVPFYTRLWKLESDAYDAEILESKAYSIDGCQNIAGELGLIAEWDEESGQSVAEGETADGYYRIWLETEESARLRIREINKFNVAGVAAWELRFANNEIWNIISGAE